MLELDDLDPKFEVYINEKRNESLLNKEQLRLQIKSIKGFKDILSDEARYYRYLESLLLQKTLQHHIEEIRFPILEKSELFNRTIGESSDIITKEMYDFIDKNGDSICLRPEGTASLVRTAIEHNLIYDRGIKKQKYWYYGPMFRHEKPQRGRYRQFNQFGIEFFGLSLIHI